MAKNSKCRWGNYFSSISFPISICLEADPLVYLSKAKSVMDRKKHSLLPSLAFSSTEFIFNTFGAKLGGTLLKRLVSNTTTFISNMIGPTDEISFHGHPILYIAPSVYGHAHKYRFLFLQSLFSATPKAAGDLQDQTRYSFDISDSAIIEQPQTPGPSLALL
uniref:O-acyltransferase WSD1 C-terminal domain-containing protein n=1 Tax=Brassica oleracea var. oleracea TaxID=109376 RepID=A0A0D3C0U4_BRAOL